MTKAAEKRQTSGHWSKQDGAVDHTIGKNDFGEKKKQLIAPNVEMNKIKKVMKMWRERKR